MAIRRIFEAHGVEFTGQRGEELYGTCPFTHKADKFYVNTRTWLWDSKTGGVSGNVARFLELIQDQYRKALTPDRLQRLCTNRGLPPEAFTPWHLGWNGSQYTIPVYDAGGCLVDIRSWRPNGKMMSTSGVEVGLLGAHHLNRDMAVPVYVCEGEWDAIAWHWVLTTANKPGVVVGVPGAPIFKTNWIPWFAGRTVHTLYDHDGAGDMGEQLARKRLKTSTQRITYCWWPEELPTGYDVRDWVKEVAIRQKKPALCVTRLHALFKDEPRLYDMFDKTGRPPKPAPENADASTSAPESASSARTPTIWTRPPTIDEVRTVFKKWLYLDSTAAIEVMLATVISQVITGPPIWMFMVSPPGGAKTETLNALSKHPTIYTTSTLTPPSLISGANIRDGVDPSLIPRLNGKVMVIKDFTSILSMRDAEKDEIFGILRDAYDGKCGKVFGTGVERSYQSRFSILAAVTPRIYDLSGQHTSLGERFLKFMMGDNLNHASEEAIIRRAIANINKESSMQSELQDVVYAFLGKRMDLRRLPDLPESTTQRIIQLGMFGARMRGGVSRDVYHHDIITSRPSAEVGSRLGIQLAKLGQSLAVVYDHAVVGDQEYTVLKKVMLDTVPQRTEDILRHMLKICPTMDDSITAVDLATMTRYPVATVSRILQDLNVLDIIHRTGSMYRYRWTVSPYIRAAIQGAELYQTADELRERMKISMRIRCARTRTVPSSSPILRVPIRGSGPIGDRTCGN